MSDNNSLRGSRWSCLKSDATSCLLVCVVKRSFTVIYSHSVKEATYTTSTVSFTTGLQLFDCQASSFVSLTLLCLQSFLLQQLLLNETTAKWPSCLSKSVFSKTMSLSKAWETSTVPALRESLSLYKLYNNNPTWKYPKNMKDLCVFLVLPVSSVFVILLLFFLLLFCFFRLSWTPSFSTIVVEFLGMKIMCHSTAENAEVMLLWDHVLIAKEVVATNGPETSRLWVSILYTFNYSYCDTLSAQAF